MRWCKGVPQVRTPWRAPVAGAEGETIPGGCPCGPSGELRRGACLGGSGTSWDRGRQWLEACPW